MNMPPTPSVRSRRSRLVTVANALLDLVFPPACIICLRPGAILCADCAQQALPVGDAICRRCGRIQEVAVDRCAICAGQPATALRMVRAATIHDTPIRQCIHALKYENHPELAQPLARYLIAVFQSAEWQTLAPTIDAVIPTPIHPERRAERGYNQAELLAQYFCYDVGLRLKSELLLRIRHTRQQVGLDVQERQENVAGAFQASPAISGQTVLLVDDVYTTGATLNACAAAAMAGGARSVYALALALPGYTPGLHHQDGTSVTTQWRQFDS